MTRFFSSAAVALVLLSAAPDVRAQQPAARVVAMATPVIDGRNEQADSLDARATALYHDPRRFEDAARLHTAAARLRPVGDERAVESLIRAGRLFAHARSYDAARQALRAAADAALQRGDVVSAAHLNIDVALVAQLEGDVARVSESVQRAETLLASPLLNDAQRARVQRRIAR